MFVESHSVLQLFRPSFRGIERHVCSGQRPPGGSSGLFRALSRSNFTYTSLSRTYSGTYGLKKKNALRNTHVYKYVCILTAAASVDTGWMISSLQPNLSASLLHSFINLVRLPFLPCFCIPPTTLSLQVSSTWQNLLCNY